MRIYLDSNIFRKLKKTSKQFRQDVFDATESIRHHLIFPFSEAHLNDLSSSAENYRNEDLQLMEQYVHDNFIRRDHIKKEIDYLLKKPSEAYQMYDFEASLSLLNNIDQGIKEIFEFEGGEIFGTLYRSLLNTPIFGQHHIDTEKLPPAYQKLAEKFKGVRSIGDALKVLGKMGDFVNDKNLLSQNRSLFTDYVKREDYSFDKWSFEFNERMKDTAFGKSFSEMLELIIPEADRSDAYHKLLNTYVALEMLGVTQERSGTKQKLKKNSFMDLQKDAAHAFYASKSDYFVSDDIGVLQKAFIAYRILGIDTEVLSTDDYLLKVPALLENEGNYEWFIERIQNVAGTGAIMHEETGLTLKKISPSIFNYFNRLQLNSGPEGSLQLFRNCQKNTVILYSEIALLIEKLTNIFGPPFQSNELKHSENFADYNIGEPIRAWSAHPTAILLTLDENGSGIPILLLHIIPLNSEN